MAGWPAPKGPASGLDAKGWHSSMLISWRYNGHQRFDTP
jgi:hypothetical protein